MSETKPLLARAKVAAFALLMFAFGFSAGCATKAGAAADGAVIEKILDAVLPPTFRGDAHVVHKNGYFNFNIRAGDLRKEDGRWVWKWLTYERNGFVSYGTVTLGNPANGAR